MGKEEWKQTGKELGGAFTGLAKTLVRSAKRSFDKAEEWAEGDEKPKEQPESTVFSDGSWKETGKDLGNAILGLGKTLINTGSEVVDDVQEWAEDSDQKEEPDADETPGEKEDQNEQ